LTQKTKPKKKKKKKKTKQTNKGPGSARKLPGQTDRHVTLIYKIFLQMFITFVVFLLALLFVASLY